MAGPLRRYACLVLGAFALPALAPAQTTVVEYYHLDALGTVRAVTNQAGEVIERHDYLPYGEEWCGSAVCSSPTAGQPLKFTGKERDAETGLDYFGARYYGSRIGRFTTTDPVYTWQENLIDPQRWNRYAYARNNPLRFTDPDGKAVRLNSDSLAAQIAAPPAPLPPGASGLQKALYFIGMVGWALNPGGIMPTPSIMAVPQAAVAMTEAAPAAARAAEIHAAVGGAVTRSKTTVAVIRATTTEGATHTRLPPARESCGQRSALSYKQARPLLVASATPRPRPLGQLRPPGSG